MASSDDIRCSINVEVEPAIRSLLRTRVDVEAEAREHRSVAPLGAGYYTDEMRGRAASLATALWRAAAEHDVSLADLDGVTSIATAALDAVAAAVARRTRR